MRRILFALFVLLSCVLISCNGEVGSEASEPSKPSAIVNTDPLIVITNLEEDGSYSAKGLGSDAPAVQGVLLKFHKEGLYDPNTSDFSEGLENPNAFYVEYLGGIKTTWYGMEFNYVLYVPDVISEEYDAGGGKNPNSGNPFWWYMQEYYGSSYNVIKNNWESNLDFLLDNASGELKAPSRNDVGGSWSDSSNSTNAKKLFAKNIGIYVYKDENGEWVGRTPDHIVYYDEPAVSNKKGEKIYQIFIPSELSAIYFSGSGVMDKLSALLWYFETYYGKSRDTVVDAYKNGTFKELLNSCYKEYGYPAPEADKVMTVEALHTVLHEDVDESKEYEFGDIKVYNSDILKLSDGTIVQAKDRIYYSVSASDDKEMIKFYVPMDYVEQIRVVSGREQKTYSGDLLWYFIRYCLKDANYSTYLSENMVPGYIVNELMKYRIDPGLQAYMDQN